MGNNRTRKPKYETDDIERIYAMYSGGFKGYAADRVLKYPKGTCGRYFAAFRAVESGEKVNDRYICGDEFEKFCNDRNMHVEFIEHEDYKPDPDATDEEQEYPGDIVDIIKNIEKYLHVMNENFDFIGGCILENTDAIKKLGEAWGIEFPEEEEQ